MTPEEQWDGPIQVAIRDWDEQQGHLPQARSEATLGGCCNPRPWQPICVGCPDRRLFVSPSPSQGGGTDG
jgi:hypothetical protein